MLSVIIIIITTLVFSAFFSGMEIAFVSSNKLKLEIERKQYRTFSRISGVFLRDPGQYITTILVGNNIALVIYSLYMSLLLGMIASGLGVTAGRASIIVETVISTIVIIFTAEFIPKAVVRANPNFFLRIFSVPVYIIYILLFPIAKFSTWISVSILRVFGMKVRSEHNIRGFDRGDLTHLLEEATENEQEKTDNEIRIFQNALDFSDVRVRDCMVPRIDIESAEIKDTIEELTTKFIDTSYSRIFIYDGTVDNIIGYVNTKSLFTCPAAIRDVLMEVDYVPESISAQRLLTSMIKKKRSVAVVIDEFGGTAGIVSMEDILEEIFGEIEDEHDSQDMVEKVIEPGQYVFSCRLEVDHLNEKYGLEIPESDQYDTLAGYIIFHHEGIPSQGEILTVGNMEIKALKVSGSRLELARVTVLQ